METKNTNQYLDKPLKDIKNKIIMNTNIIKLVTVELNIKI